MFDRPESKQKMSWLAFGRRMLSLRSRLFSISSLLLRDLSGIRRLRHPMRMSRRRSALHPRHKRIPRMGHHRPQSPPHLSKPLLISSFLLIFCHARKITKFSSPCVMPVDIAVLVVGKALVWEHHWWVSHIRRGRGCWCHHWEVWVKSAIGKK